ncbi:uncharacterized protein LOC130046402 isoform X2 [Ostrea edulis]|nr:uncharacterized protein LOC130046402 isoform X2 [Ostrea edulis]XP_056021545.1 uncharacterized protein LOC130046402 isoform X2 [Ostrea edulis]
MRVEIFPIFFINQIAAVHLFLNEKISEELKNVDPFNIRQEFTMLRGRLAKVLNIENPKTSCMFTDVLNQKLLLRNPCFEIVPELNGMLGNKCIGISRTSKCIQGIQRAPRHKRDVEKMLSSVRNFMHFIGRSNSVQRTHAKPAKINIKNSLDYAATDFTSNIRPHLSRLLGKFRVMQTGSNHIGNDAKAAISYIQHSIGKTVSDIDGTIVKRARRFK